MPRGLPEDAVTKKQIVDAEAKILEEARGGHLHDRCPSGFPEDGVIKKQIVDAEAKISEEARGGHLHDGCPEDT